MIRITINIKNNSIITFFKDGSISLLPLDTYEFKEEEEYSAIVLTGDIRTEYREPEMIRGDFLIAFLKSFKTTL